MSEDLFSVLFCHQSMDILAEKFCKMKDIKTVAFTLHKDIYGKQILDLWPFL